MRRTVLLSLCGVLLALALTLSLPLIAAASDGASRSVSDQDIDVSPSSIGVDPLVIDVILDRDQVASEQFTISNSGPETLFFDFNIVDTTPGLSGSTDIGLEAAPSNDDFPGKVVTESSFTDGQNIIDATLEPNEYRGCRPSGQGGPINHSVWYNVTPAEDGTITAEIVVPTTGESSLAAFTGSPLAFIDCDYHGLQAPAQIPTEISFPGLAGHTYYFQAGGVTGYKDQSFTLDVAGGIGNDLTWVSVDPGRTRPPSSWSTATPGRHPACRGPDQLDRITA